MIVSKWEEGGDVISGLAIHMEIPPPDLAERGIDRKYLGIGLSAVQHTQLLKHASAANHEDEYCYDKEIKSYKDYHA